MEEVYVQHSTARMSLQPRSTPGLQTTYRLFHEHRRGQARLLSTLHELFRVHCPSQDVVLVVSLVVCDRVEVEGGVPRRGALQALLEGHGGHVAEHPASLGDVCAGAGHIAWLVRELLDDGPLPRGGADHLDEVPEAHRVSVAEVVDLVAARPVQGAHDSGGDVVDVRVVAAGGAVAELLDGLATEDAVDELERRHVGPSARPVDGEEAKAGDLKAVERVPRVRKQLAGGLGGRVRAHGLVDDVLLGEGILAGSSIDRRARSEHEVLAVVLARHLHQPGGRLDVAVQVHEGVLDAGPHPGARGQVHHMGDALVLPDSFQQLRIAAVAVVELEAAGAGLVLLLEQAQVLLLDGRVVVVVHLVQHHHLVAAVQQNVRHVGTNEAGGAGHQHGLALLHGLRRPHRSALRLLDGVVDAQVVVGVRAQRVREVLGRDVGVWVEPGQARRLLCVLVAVEHGLAGAGSRSCSGGRESDCDSKAAQRRSRRGGLRLRVLRFLPLVRVSSWKFRCGWPQKRLMGNVMRRVSGVILLKQLKPGITESARSSLGFGGVANGEVPELW
eukprot:scaffold1307_cov200-Pinguiococcus_pyrenoidosus.AAC.152